MNKKRVVALLLALGMAGSLLAGCSSDTQNPSSDGGSDIKKNDVVSKEGLPIAKEKITITAMGCKDPGAAEWNDLLLFQKAEEKTNIHFEFEPVSYTHLDVYKRQGQICAHHRGERPGYAGLPVYPETFCPGRHGRLGQGLIRY